MFKRTGLVMLVGLVTVGSGAVAFAGPPQLPQCGTPVMGDAPEYAAGASNTVSWTAPAPYGGGFVVEVASSPDLDSSGALVNVEQTAGNVSSSATSYTFEGLSEGPHWYQVRAKNNPQSCHASNWSGSVSTVQDQTAPAITITAPDEGEIILLAPFTVSGTLSDTASGPDVVTVTAVNTTPAVGELQPSATATVDASTGQWTATFEGLLPGTYDITAVGTDQVGNSSEPASISVIYTTTV